VRSQDIIDVEQGEEVGRRAVVHPLVDVATEVIDGGNAAADVADR
jgi:hypothetical protein